MSYQSDKFRSSKQDQTPYLFHFTSGTTAQAKANLRSILEQKKLVSGSADCICFTASPITQIGSFFDTKVNRTNQPMYQPYGIAFARDTMIRTYGAKNVIYGDKIDEAALASLGLDWRFVHLDVDTDDFEWLREWRTHGKVFDFSNFPIEDILVITPTEAELHELIVEEDIDYSYDFDPYTGEAYPDVFEVYNRKWRGMSLERISFNQFKNDYAISAFTQDQIIGADMFDDVAEECKRQFDRFCETMRAAKMPPFVL